jgi:DNA repair protein RadC
MTVKMLDVPANDRPRERLLQHGHATLSDAELVAVQLGSGHAGASALEVAQRLLAEWGGVAGLVRARPEELARARGVGPAKATRLVAAFGLGLRAGRTSTQPVLENSEDIAKEATALIGHSRTEQVAVLVVDSVNRMIRAEIVASGSAKACPVPVREIVSTVLRHDGVGFAVAHNHPGGDPAPTLADVRATEALSKAAQVVGLRFLDHVTLGESTWKSVNMQQVV